MELLIVMAIIAILAGLSLFALRGTRESARDGRRLADLETIRSALEIYRADCDYYPETSLTPLTTGCAPANNVYLEAVPTDDSAGRAYFYISI